MCAVILRVKYLAVGEPPQSLEMETKDAAAERQRSLEQLGTVESITWFHRGESYARTVTYAPSAQAPTEPI